MLTEEEAKTKWCPHVRVLASTDGAKAGVNMILTGDDLLPDRSKSNCIASACMAWRWRRRYADDAKEAKISHVTGYCGLAGKP